MTQNFYKVQAPWRIWLQMSGVGRTVLLMAVAGACLCLAGLPKWPQPPPDRAGQPPEVILRDELIQGLQQLDGVEAVAVSVLPAQELLGEPVRLIIMVQSADFSAKHVKNRVARAAPSVAPSEILVVDTTGQNLLPNRHPLQSVVPRNPYQARRLQMVEKQCHTLLQALVPQGNYELALQLDPSVGPRLVQLRIASPLESALVRPRLAEQLRLEEDRFQIERLPFGHQALSPAETKKLNEELVRPEPPYPTESLMLLAPGLFLLLLYYVDLKGRHRTRR